MKVVRHYDYGMALDSMPNENGIVQDNFYFCFLELDNEKTICVHTYKSYDDNKKTYEWNEFGSIDDDGNDIIVGYYNITYAKDYKFGEEFFKWFDRSLNIPFRKGDKFPSREEKNCAIDYYEKNIKPT